MRMGIHRRLVGIFVLSLIVGISSGVGFVACAGKVVGATPVAAAALKADAVVVRVNEFQAAVIDVCGPAPECRPGGVTTAQARLFVQTAIDLRSTLKAVPAGWQATAKAAWQAALPKFTTTNPAIVAAIAAVSVALGGI